MLAPVLRGEPEEQAWKCDGEGFGKRGSHTDPRPDLVQTGTEPTEDF